MALTAAVALSPSTPVQASLIDASGSDYLVQRVRFKVARKLLARGDIEGFKLEVAQLEGYPVLAYLEYARLLREMPDNSPDLPSRIEAFVANNEDSHLPAVLLDKWLGNLHGNKRWSELVSWSTRFPGRLSFCKLSSARLALGEVTDRIDLLRRVWIEEPLLANDCQSLAQSLAKS